MSLPLPWVDRIFEKLTLVYGQAFLARWRDLDLDAVKADWAHELDGFERHPKAIAHALQALPPEKPPTVLQFRELARRAPLPLGYPFTPRIFASAAPPPGRVSKLPRPFVVAALRGPRNVPFNEVTLIRNLTT